MDLSFYPNKERAIALDRRMCFELAQSLEQLCSQIEIQLPPSESVIHTTKLNTVVSALNKPKRISPAVFAAYYQLIFSILNEEDHLSEKVDELVLTVSYREGLTFRDLSVTGLGTQKLVTLYNGCLDTDNLSKFEFLPPEEDESKQTKASVLKALSLMHDTVPAMANEFTAIVIEVILAAASKQPNAYRFDGASSYMLWGALVLSVDDEKTDLEMMETLAHESAHSFLFGLTIKEPLTFNDENERYNSPLRRDPRPMDGIYHATFVSARMHFAMNEARKSGLLNDAQQKECIEYLAASNKAFYDGYNVVTQQGELSPTGQEVMDNAHDYMKEHAFA